jgi:hypothetical protein
MIAERPSRFRTRRLSGITMPGPQSDEPQKKSPAPMKKSLLAIYAAPVALLLM